VLMPGPIFDAVESLHLPAGVPIILTSPQGRLFSQAVAHELAAYHRLALICGHYEGVDERVREHLVTDEISIGDYVLSGGEIPAMVIADAVARLLPGAMDVESGREESHAAGLLEYPQYTRPAVCRGWEVPPILLSGHHGAIARWRRLQALRRTFEHRPDLLATAPLSAAERALVRQWEQEKARSDAPAPY
jgi:tRNA (guanine37-N1)-methyltransferase